MKRKRKNSGEFLRGKGAGEDLLLLLMTAGAVWLVYKVTAGSGS